MLIYLQTIVIYGFVGAEDDPLWVGGMGLGMAMYVIFSVGVFLGFNMAITTFTS
jgi:hypothetical protein